MLNALRKSVKTLPMKILLGLLVAAFALWGIGDIFSFRLNDRVAQVGDTEVPAQRFADALVRQQSELTRQTRQYVSFDDMRAAGIDRRILAALVRDAAFTEELNALGLSAPDAQVAEAVRANTVFQDPGGRFSNQAYSLFLAQQRMTPQEFEELTRTLLSQQILTETAGAAIDAPPGTGARIAAYQGERRTISATVLTLDMAPDPGQPDEAALQEFYDANEPMFTEPERRWGTYIHIDAEKLAEALTPDEAALRAAYEAEADAYTVAETRVVDQISIPDQAAAEAAIGRLASGDVTFEELGKEYGISGEALSLGRITQADLPEAAAGVVFDKDTTGIVGPVALPAGYGIFRISEITEGGTATFEDVRDQIAQRLAQNAVRGRAPELANMVDDLRSEGLPLADIATRLAAEPGGAAIVQGEFEGLARNGTLAGGENAEGVLGTPAFITDVFDALDNEERDLVETPEGGYLLVMVRRIEPSALLPLEQVRDRAVTAWQNAKRLEALEAEAAEIAAGLDAQTSIWDVAEQRGTVVQPYGPFSRLSPPAGLSGELVDLAFDAEKDSGISVAAEDGGSVIVAQVTSITPLEPEQMADAAEQIDEILAQSLQADTVEYFARAIEARHPAYLDPTVIDDVFTRLGAVGGPSQ